MATSVTINGAVVRQGPQNDLIVIYDVTVGGKHHMVPFLKSDLIAQGSIANIRTYVAKQSLTTDTVSTTITTVPTSDLDIRGTVSV